MLALAYFAVFGQRRSCCREKTRQKVSEVRIESSETRRDKIRDKKINSVSSRSARRTLSEPGTNTTWFYRSNQAMSHWSPVRGMMSSGSLVGLTDMCSNGTALKQPTDKLAATLSHTGDARAITSLLAPCTLARRRNFLNFVIHPRQK